MKTDRILEYILPDSKLMSTLILELPELLDSRHANDMSHPIEALALPNLSHILSKADKLCLQQSYALPLSTLELEGILNPAWAVNFLELANAEDDFKYWFRVDPVELQTDINAVYLKGNRHLQLSHNGMEQIKRHLQECFVEFGAKLILLSEREGYIGCNQHNKVNFVSMLSCLSKNQINSLACGEDAPFWNNLLSEIQMSLFGSSAPTTKISELAPINSVFFWGDSEAKLPKLTIDRLISNSNLLLGLGAVAKIEVNTLDGLTIEEIISHSAKNNRTQIVDMELLWLRKQGMVYEWQQKIKQLEEVWLPKIIQALKEKKINELLLVSSSEQCFRLRYSYLKRFWRRKKPIKNFLQK